MGYSKKLYTFGHCLPGRILTFGSRGNCHLVTFGYLLFGEGSNHRLGTASLGPGNEV